MPDAAASIRPPQQKRSHASFARVLQAGTKLLEEEGYERFTLAEVSRRAGVSIGSIYARVPSKDALFYAIHAEAMEVIAAEDRLAATGDLEALPAGELIIEAVARLAEPFRVHARILRVVMHRGAVDDVIASRGSAASSERGERFSALLLTRREDIRHPNPELAVDVAYRMAYCTLARQVMYGPTFESQRAVEWNELVHELGCASTSYLLGPAV